MRDLDGAYQKDGTFFTLNFAGFEVVEVDNLEAVLFDFFQLDSLNML